MFDCHQAEITVMPFRGYSLPEHQSMSVSWAFTLSHFVSQIHQRDFFRLQTIGMCNFLPVHHFEMACLAGSKVNIQHLIYPTFHIFPSFYQIHHNLSIYHIYIYIYIYIYKVEKEINQTLTTDSIFRSLMETELHCKEKEFF